MSDDRVIAALPMHDGAEIRISLSVFKGSPYFSIRQWFRADSGEWCPTKRGVTVSVERLGELETAIAKLREAVAKEPARRPDRIQKYAERRRAEAGR
jgi:hypothetical protein